MKKVMMFLFAVLFMVSFASAVDFNNVKVYDANSTTATIKDSLLGDDLLNVTLNTPIFFRVGYGAVFKVAEFEVVNLDDATITNFLDNMQIINLNSGQEEGKIITYKYKVNTIQVINDSYQENCTSTNVFLNGTMQYICDTGYRNFTIYGEDWYPITDFSVLAGQSLTIGMFTYVNKGDLYEWIPTITGVEIPEFATWSSGLNVGLWSYYKFNNNSDDDLGINNGTNTPNAWVSGKIDYAAGFTGSGSINMGDVFDIGTENFSFSYWFKQPSSGNYEYHIGKSDASPAGDWEIRKNNADTLEFNLFGGSYAGVSSPMNISDDVWKHVVVTRNTGNGSEVLDMWINGTKVATTVGTLQTSVNSSHSFRVGSVDPSGFYLTGIIDELGLWGRVLTDQEISDLYNNYSGTTRGPVFGVTPIIPLNNTKLSSPITQVFNWSIDSADFIANTTFSLYYSNGTLVNNVTTIFYPSINVTSRYVNESFIFNTNEGNYTWNVTACDIFSICDISGPINLEFDLTPYPIYISPTPANNSVITTQYLPISVQGVRNETQNFTFINDTYIANGTIYVWNTTSGGLLATHSASSNPISNNFTLANGNYTFGAVMTSQSGKSNSTGNRTITIFFPEVNLVAPLNNIVSDYKLNQFIFNGSSYYDISNYSLFTNESGFSAVATSYNISAGIFNGSINYTVVDDSILWGIRICDINSLCIFSSNNTLSINPVPVISFISPTLPNGSISGGSYLDIAYNETNNAFQNATLSIYNDTGFYSTIYSTNSSPSYSLALLNANYTFNVTAYSPTGRVGSSETRFITQLGPQILMNYPANASTPVVPSFVPFSCTAQTFNGPILSNMSMYADNTTVGVFEVKNSTSITSSAIMNVTSNIALGGNLQYYAFYVQPGVTVTVNGTGYLNISAEIIDIKGTIDSRAKVSGGTGAYVQGPPNQWLSGSTGSGDRPGVGGSAANSPDRNACGGGGAGGASSGTTASSITGCSGGSGGSSIGTLNGSDTYSGSGGGGAGAATDDEFAYGGDGGSGAGWVAFHAKNLNVTGTIHANGNTGGAATCDNSPDSTGGGGGGGSGATILLEGETVVLNSATFNVQGGGGGSGCETGSGTGYTNGGAGSGGRIKVFYETLSNTSQTNNLGTGTFYAATQTFNDAAISFSDSFTLLGNFSINTQDNTNWYCVACRSDSSCFTTIGNYTVVPDTTAPVITLTSPVSVNQQTNGDNLFVNWSISETSNLSTCWFSYNNVNTTVNCTDTSKNFTYVALVNSLTFYANNSYGVLGTATRTWQPTVTLINQTYNAETLETRTETFNSYVSYTSANWSTAVMSLIWNGTAYPATTSGNGDVLGFTRVLAMPTISTATNVTLYWSLALTNGTGTYLYNSTPQTQLVEKVDFQLCNYSSNAQLTFNTFSTTAPTQRVNTTFTSAWQITTVGGTVLLAENYQNLDGNRSSYSFCISPTTSNYTVSIDISVDAAGYTATNHYIVDTDYATPGENISIYLLADNSSTLTELQVVDWDYNPIEDVYITVQRYDLFSDTYYNVAMAKTSYLGSDLVYTEWYNSWYKFVLVKDGEVVGTFGPLKISESPQVFRFGQAPVSNYTKFNEIEYSLTYVENTSNFVLTFVKPSGEVNSGCLRVIKRNVTNDYNICDVCETSNSATLYCNVASAGNGTFIADFYATGSFAWIDTLIETIGAQNELYELIGNDNGTGLAIIMAGIILSFFLISPAVAVFGMILGMLATYALGFQPFDTAAFLGIVLLGGAVIWAVKR